MFNYFFKQSKLHHTMMLDIEIRKQNHDITQAALDDECNRRTSLLTEIEELKTKIKSLESAGAASIDEGNSSVIFEFDKNLKVLVKSRINSDITMKLIDEKYITPEFAEDEATIQFAFILLANEATEQIIEGVNEH